MPVLEPHNHAQIILHAFILELIMDLFVAAYKLVLEVEAEVEIFILHYLMLNFLFFLKQNLTKTKKCLVKKHNKKKFCQILYFIIINFF
jgi:hypothetical protein